MTTVSRSDKAVVVHRGARDGYQLALALAEAGKLESLVTDLYWPAGTPGAERLRRWLPAGAVRMLKARSCPALSPELVHTCPATGLASLALEKSRKVPFAWKQAATRRTDAVLGQTAGELASASNAALVSYSYYGHSAFSHYRGSGARVLFQLHPHPVSVRRLLSEELAAHPDCADSLRREWELSLPQQDFERLAAEPAMAAHWLVASSFTRRTLVENGASAERIHVVPYGVDADRFRPSDTPQAARTRPLRLLFVGTINQRKGIKYAVEAIRSLPAGLVKFVVCGRVVDDLQLFQSLGNTVRIRPSVSDAELQEEYRQADILLFPSVVEGFGHVLLEAMASGLPILTTDHTAAPDLITSGVEGFIVPVRRADLLAERIRWAAEHRSELFAMRAAARATAQQFSWARFRSGVRAALSGILQPDSSRKTPPKALTVSHV